jgi:Family of unknown function (DUF6527)
MSKLSKVYRPDSKTLGGYAHWCEGCQSYHLFDLRWTFNGDFDKPTFSPSMLVNATQEVDNAPRCHYFLRNGKIQYLDDSTHNLKGKTIELKEI